MTAAIHRQPPEILHRIADFLPPSDIKRLRLVSRMLSGAGAVFVFREVALFVSDRSIAALRSIADSPHLAEHVVTLTINTKTHRAVAPLEADAYVDAAAVSWWLRDQSWAHEYQQARDDAAASGGAKPDPPAAWASYTALAREQARLITAGDDVAVLAHSISKLPRLANVEISSSHLRSVQRLPGIKDPWLRLEDDTGATLPSIVTDEYAIDRALAGTLVGMQKRHAKPGSGVRSLHAGTLNWRFINGAPPAADPPPGPGGEEVAAAAAAAAALRLPWLNTAQATNYASLTSVNFRIDSAKSSVPTIRPRGAAGECRAALDQGHLASFLASLSALRFLTVVFTHKQFDGYVGDGLANISEVEYPASLRHIVPLGHVWPHLQTLMLGNIDCDGADLCDALTAHGKSLIHLGLQGLRLNCMPWATLVRHAKAALPRLVDVCIVGASYAYSGPEPQAGQREGWYFCLDTPPEDDTFFTSVTEYLLRDNVDMPLDPQRMHFDFSNQPDHEREWADFGRVVPVSASREYRLDRLRQAAESEFGNKEDLGYSLGRRPGLNAREWQNPFLRAASAGAKFALRPGGEW